MTTPTKDEIREKALELYWKNHFNDECKNTPTDEELKEWGYWVKAQIALMSKKSEYEKAEENIIYLKLVEDCMLIVQKLRKTSEDVIRCWHALGTRILQNGDYEKSKWESGKLIERLAHEIKVSCSTIYHALEFAHKYPDLEEFLTCKKLTVEKLTWRYIIHNLLYEPTSKPPKPKITIEIDEETPKVEIDIKKFETNIIDRILNIADEIDLESATKKDLLLCKSLVEAVYKYEFYDECYDQVWDFVTSETGKLVIEVNFTIDFESNHLIVLGYVDKESQTYEEFDGKIFLT